jgi:hypothetical protein
MPDDEPGGTLAIDTFMGLSVGVSFLFMAYLLKRSR